MTKRFLLSTAATFAAPSETAAAAPAAAPKALRAKPSYPPEKQSPESAIPRRGRPQAPRAPPYRGGAYSVSEFCEAHRLSVPMFYKLQKRGEAPDITKIGARTIITYEAAKRWRRDRERATKQFTKES